MSLKEYTRKRSFSKTPEPAARSKNNKVKNKALVFVVQKHAASHLHYDFRLEMKGALKSWAVPKGPSMNPADKRLAMLVEDHPFDYRNFEGIIPKGNYGAGTVIIWDQGEYEPAVDEGTQKLSREEKEKLLLKGFYSGKLSILLKGKKLKGEFTLVSAKGREENAWLLMKKKDKQATETDITKKSKSVVSGKTIEEMSRSVSAKQWSSNRDSNGKLKTTRAGSRNKKVISNIVDKKPYDQLVSKILVSLSKKLPVQQGNKLTTNKKLQSRQPKNLRPMLATLASQPFDDPGWTYEIKWDGYRALAYLNKGMVELRSRNNNSFEKQFYPVFNALAEWPIHAIVDGEIVVINEEGHSNFGSLQNWRSEADGDLVYYVFDLLWLDGRNMMELPLPERRAALEKLVPPEGLIRFSESFETSGTEFFKAAEKMKLEGIIAKRNDSEYVPGTRTRNWLKIKTSERHEALICGYTRNEDSRKKFSALILGILEKGELKFIGQVGTGFTDKLQADILRKLNKLKTKKCPFTDIPVINKPTRFRPNPPKATVTWVKPELVCEVSYTALTSEGIMRHPSFEGIRDDKSASELTPIQKPEKPGKSKTNKASKLLKTPASKQRIAFLNPHEETQTRAINGHDLKFTNLSKIYWPNEKISKRDMLNYYYRVAPIMLPYMKDRPQSLNRHPNGINGESFYQKNVKGKVEHWLSTHHYENTSHPGEKTFLVCTDEASLLYIAKLGCIEMNPWHSRVQSPDRPDWCVIDLDPDNNPFDRVIECALTIKEILDTLGVSSYPKTSGSTGVHIYIPLGAKYSYEQSRQLAELIVTIAQPQLKGITSIERNPLKRKGKIYLDYLQNRAIQTIAAPYSLRPKPGATVSAPLHWEELKPGLKIQDFNIHNMHERIKEQGDIFSGVLGKGIDLQKVLQKASKAF